MYVLCVCVCVCVCVINSKDVTLNETTFIGCLFRNLSDYMDRIS